MDTEEQKNIIEEPIIITKTPKKKTSEKQLLQLQKAREAKKQKQILKQVPKVVDDSINSPYDIMSYFSNVSQYKYGAAGLFLLLGSFYTIKKNIQSYAQNYTETYEDVSQSQQMKQSQPLKMSSLQLGF